LSSGQRFQETSQAKTGKEEPGPGAYTPQTSLKDCIDKRSSRGLKGKFNNTETRFKSGATTQGTSKPGPGAYEIKSEFIPPAVIEGVSPESHFFKAEPRKLNLAGGFGSLIVVG
jgi:acyl-CoA reductase-like NAD-dependent aldehyde dehydrogenase